MKQAKALSMHVALLRGVNVGAKNLLPMRDLAELFVDAGCGGVRTYIQSGNVIFTAAPGVLKEIPDRIAREISQRFGYRIPVILRTAKELGDTIHNNPFANAGADEKMLYVYFLAGRPKAEDAGKLDPDRSRPDSYVVRDREIYLHLPNGMARTKLTNAYFDSKLATTSTARNWRTVLKLFELMEGG
jgi:uncharacterized protein (DUF1697 family)